MRFLTADKVFPVSAGPVDNGIVAIHENGVIEEVIYPEIYRNQGGTADKLEKYSGWLIPGLINTHCHLELSYMKGVVTPKTGMANFIRELLRDRFKFTEEFMQESYKNAEDEMLNNGIVAVGDISNFEHSLYIKQQGRLYYHTFVELLGMNPYNAGKLIDDAEPLQEKFATVPKGNSTIVPHAPYTVCPRLFDLLKERCYSDDLPVTIHMQESPAEEQFIDNLTGDFTTLFDELKFDYSMMPAYHTKPIRAVLPALSSCNRLLMVHNTLTTAAEIQWAHTIHKNIFWTLCPKANIYIENRLPYIPSFIAANGTITLGTDSLTSNDSLSIAEEMKAIHHHFPEITLEMMIPWATLNGAKALSIEKQYGSLEKNKTPGVALIEKDFSVMRIV